MTAEQQYFISLSKAAVFGETPPTPPQELDWKWMLDKSMEQNITGLLASAIDRLPDEQKPANYKQWHLLMLQTVMIMSRKADEFERMAKILAQNGIEFIVLKGMAVKSLYGKDRELLRTMGDFDILIESAKRKLVEEIFRDEGYKINNRTFLIEVDKENIHGEVFVSLEEEFKSDANYWNKRLKEESYLSVYNKQILKPTYNLFYTIVHMSKHFMGRGCGIRNLLDIALILKHQSDKIDFEELEKDCDQCGIKKIYMYIMSVMKKDFGVVVPGCFNEPKTDIFMEYILNYGIFGRDVDKTLFANRVMESGLNNRLELLFPPIESLKNEYSYLEKSNLLLPIVWVHRFFRGIFIKKYSLKSLIRGFNKSLEFKKEKEQWFKKMDMKSKKS